MSRIKRKFIELANTSTGVNGQAIPANFTPSFYTPAQVASEGTDKISAHLKGIDNDLSVIKGSAGDIIETSFSIANNQSSAANITGLAFANGIVRSFSAILSIYVDATTDQFSQIKIDGIQKSASWDINVSEIGDITGIEVSITSAGQLQYTSPSFTGFSSGTMKFRAITTSV